MTTDRRKITFSQAEGLESLPTPLKPKELSDPLRTALWNVIYEILRTDIHSNSIGGGRFLSGRWNELLRTIHTDLFHQPLDEFRSDPEHWVPILKRTICEGEYNKVFDLIQFIVRSRHCTSLIPPKIKDTLKKFQAAYDLIDNDTFVPISTPEEAQVFVNAMEELRQTEFGGARAHLKQAGVNLTNGKFPDSVRESIHAVESVVKKIAQDDSADLTKALRAIEKKGLTLHGGFKSGLDKLYAYTSDEKGIRHSLLEDESRVDEADAQFMLGACAAFVSYLVSKGRTTGLVK